MGRTSKISGVCQVTVIAALCFLIFIHDLPDTVKDSFTGIVCDDTLIAKEIKCQKDTDDLQADIVTLLKNLSIVNIVNRILRYHIIQ